MRQLKCWICGHLIVLSAIAQDKPFYLETRIVGVNKPYGLNHKSRPVFICKVCALSKIGISREGENLNNKLYPSTRR